MMFIGIALYDEKLPNHTAYLFMYALYSEVATTWGTVPTKDIASQDNIQVN